MFLGLPNLRLLPPCDSSFFKKGKARIKKYRIQNKENWVEAAQRIILSQQRQQRS
jgi:hypothetical protein